VRRQRHGISRGVPGNRADSKDAYLLADGLQYALLGISYAFMALIPGFFIAEKMYDPKSLQAADIRAETEK
ncbi:MAG: hypothetical protein ACXWMS_06240, partial [Syntrophales bacterium]